MSKAGSAVEQRAADAIKEAFRMKILFSQKTTQPGQFFTKFSEYTRYRRKLYRFAEIKRTAREHNVAPPDELLMEVQNRLEFYMESIKRQISQLPSL